ncbi:MAG: hypothetical protein IBX64_06545 [Actinobacteria bacterium]|nr:hypothetical protein [Actinomycetota bacterium]
MFRRLLKDESGMAVIIVASIMAILAIVGFGVIVTAKNDFPLTERDRSSMKALHVAEAGINKALWAIGQYGSETPRSFRVDVANFANVDTGTAEVTVIPDLDTGWIWTITSTGNYRNSKRILKVCVFSISMWNMHMGLGQADSIVTTSNGTQGTTSVTGPFYARGNLLLSGNTSIEGGPLFVKDGTVYLENNAVSIGTSTDKILAYIEPMASNAAIWDPKAGREVALSDDRVHIKKLSNQVPNIPLPLLKQLSVYREHAAQESEENVVPYPGIISKWAPPLSGYKVLDNDTELSTGNVASRRTYTINSSTGNFGIAGGEFAWDKGGKKLYIDGTIFVDGNLIIGDTANSEINYYGKGTIVVNGDITIKGRLRPEAPYHMSSDAVLGLVTGESIYIDTSGGGGNNKVTRDVPDVCGAFFATKKVQFLRNNISFVGSLISGLLDFGSNNNNHLFTYDSLPYILPPNMPGGNEYITVTSSWREISRR